MYTFGTHGNCALIPPGMSLFQLNNIETITIQWFLYCGVRTMIYLTEMF